MDAEAPAVADAPTATSGETAPDPGPTSAATTQAARAPREEPRPLAPETEEEPASLLSRWGLAFASLLYAVVVTARTHSFFVFPYAVPVSNDEGYLSAMALRMVHGHFLPYVDGVSQRGPVLYWLTAAVMRVFGLWSWVPIRGLGLALSLAILAMTFALAAALHSPAAAAISALVCTYFLTYELAPWDGVGVNGEPLALTFVLGACLLFVRLQGLTAAKGPDARSPGFSRRGRALRLAGVGALLALAGLSKQMFLLHALPIAAWLFLDPDGDRAPLAAGDEVRARVRAFAPLALGFALPYLLVVGVYGIAGELATFVYYYQRYGREIFMAPLNAETIRDKVREQIDRFFYLFASLFTAYAALFARALRGLVARDGEELRARTLAQAPTLFVLAQTLFGALGACFTFRFFPHYFVQVLPMLALCVGMLAGESFRRVTLRERPAWVSFATMLAAAMLLLGVAHSALHRNVRFRRETDRWYQPPGQDPIVRYVTERTEPGDRIFVWGFRAETYLSARRLPGSRYVYTVYPAGVVPWFPSTRDEEESRQVPGSRQLMLEDLERERPELVIDAGRSMSGRYMYNYPQLRAYIDRQYCFMRYVDGEPVYRRRHTERCPPADY